MYLKLVTLTGFAVVLAGTLLMLRHERLVLANDLANAKAQSRQLERHLWRAQAQAAALTTPDYLKRRLGATRLAFEPAVPEFDDRPTTRVVRGPDDPDEESRLP